MYTYYYDTNIGVIYIAEENGYITNISFKNVSSISSTIIKETPIIKDTYIQINDYLNKKRKYFDIPYLIKGTEFQNKVWNELLNIPYGETRSYKEIATAINNPKSCRAVGLANNKNPLPLIVPCHRVIGSNNKLVGYAGGLHIKEFLLKLEENI